MSACATQGSRKNANTTQLLVSWEEQHQILSRNALRDRRIPGASSDGERKRLCTLSVYTVSKKEASLYFCL